MNLKPLKRHGISDDISHRILDLVKSGYFKPGEKLPTERELSEQLQVSRPSLREAMRSLAFMNVIEIRQGSGMFVSSLEPELLVEHLDFVFSLENANPGQLLQARQIVEPQSAALAAARITEEQLAAIHQVIEETLLTADNLERHVELDIKLHNMIVGASGNPLLIRFMASITYLDKITRFDVMKSMLEITRNKRVHQAYDDHERILEALRAKNPVAASEVMTQHLQHVETSMRETGHIKDTAS